MKYPKYQEVNEILGQGSQLMTPAEAHGLLAGILCAGLKNIEDDAWEESGFFTLGNEQLSQVQLSILKQLFFTTREKITHMDFDFQLFLPDDDTPLKERAKAFGCWCQGFLSGFGIAGGQLDETKHFDSIEAVHRISDAAQIDYNSLDVSEADEVSFVEVTEYVRMAVLIIFSDMHTTTDDTDKETNKKYH